MDLMRQLPPQCYNGERHVKELEDALGKQVRDVQQARDDLYLQARPSTATWGLSNYEREYNIPTDLSKPIAQRLALWRAKRKGHGTTTVEVILGMAQAAFGGSAEVTELYSRYLVKIRAGGNSLANRWDFQAAVEEIIPAHLALNYYFDQYPDIVPPRLTAAAAMTSVVIHNHIGG